MSVALPNGAVISIASSYITAANITALSNASAAIATAANTLVAGDFVEVTSGWSRLTNKVVRVASPTSTAFTLEGYDTTATSVYPATAGTGSFRKVAGWTQLSQILTSASSGGDQQFTDYQFLESDAATRIPTFKAPAQLTFSVADDPTLAGYILAKVANDDRLTRAIKVVLPNGSILLYNAYVSLASSPSLTVNEVMAVEVTMSLRNEPVRYAS